ncbi:DHHC zinc finger membrane protein [Talaromyces proteolyticus]|uniref:Palmitoyltransferase n=1 Tax=Talaromyces proteolyticus TaxID=1131652 RepID=A0AAD4Q0A8_9EURO|nr:DHHC zinc finger membrane protein [Talaromyces proteolyticus]KAH8696728.1 DHHC zinc finger membrane protein [Talaromyces proteolyticus]
MATLGSPEMSPKRRPRTWARKIERLCVVFFGYVPLAFVYGLSTWAVWVEAGVGFLPNKSTWIGFPSSTIGILLYILLNLSYTVAVFTDPGSPVTSSSRSSGRGQYSHLPTTELPEYQSYTVNSHGGARFCKKCQCPKPDRTHHCSSCKRCVLKMDHHCPWLATCVGLRNYKAFLLFLIYTSVFCWVCFGTAGLWVWDEVLTEVSYIDTLMPVNVILLAVIAGIIGLVLSGFTAWHISLAMRNVTTIESLEKTRYLSPLRNALDRHRSDNHTTNDHNSSIGPGDDSFGHRLQGYGQQIIEAHANAIPGVTRVEEGEERQSPPAENRGSQQQDYVSFLRESNTNGTPAQQALHRSYEESERQRERDRYEDYLDSKDNETMPNPFDHGWQQNLRHLFGDNPLLWALPICNTSGDGWYWEPSAKFLEVRERIRQNREQEWSNWLERQRQQSYEYWVNGTHQRQAPTKPVSIQRHGKGGQNGVLGASFDRPGTGVSMKTLRPMSPRMQHDDTDGENYETSSDEDRPKHTKRGGNKAERVLGISRDQAGSSRDEWRDWD